MKSNAAYLLVAAALAAGIAPDPDLTPSTWAAEKLVLVDGPKSGEKWDPAETPQLVEVLDCLATSTAYTEVTLRKSAQTGATQVGVGWIGSIMDATPARAMVVFPTIMAVQDFNREKLQPTIEDTPALRRKVREQTSRSGAGSTTLSKRYPGGSLTLTGANSAADLRSKTIKYLFADEIDEWPSDLAGQGDPMEMADARQIAFHSTGEYKKFQCSTPTIKGASRIDVAFEAGDQRFWNMPCPHCGHEQKLVFKNLKFEKTYPYNAHYVCAESGCIIEHRDKRAMIRAGRWIAENPGPGHDPSFHLDALSSNLTTWDMIAKVFLDSKDDPQKLKTFVNLWLGEAWEERGEAPEWQRLFARRADYPMRAIPPGGLVITTAADVQKKGIFYETVAWGPGSRSWSIDIGFLEGEPADTDDTVWRALDDVYERTYTDAWGNHREIDAFGVDAGYLTNQVYYWVRKKPKAKALDGRAGWQHPPLGTPSKREITLSGRKRPGGVLLWPVGTYSLKAAFYANLRKEGLKDGAEMDPPGYCHFSADHDDAYFKQIVAEYIKEREHRGRVIKDWVARGDNHFHDCRVYNMALAEHLGISRLDAEAWQDLAADRNVPAETRQADFAGLWSGLPVATAPDALRRPESEAGAPESAGAPAVSARKGRDLASRLAGLNKG